MEEFATGGGKRTTSCLYEVKQCVLAHCTVSYPDYEDKDSCSPETVLATCQFAGVTSLKTASVVSG
jgi:hypothetical protein